MKHFMVHGAQTLQASSVRILIALASVFHFRIQSTDIKLAYLQSTGPLRRRVFITNPANEFIWIRINALNFSNYSMAYATLETCGTNRLIGISRKT